MYRVQKIDQSIFRAIDEEKVKELEDRIQNFKKVFYLFIKIYIDLFFQEREVNKENRIKAEQAKNARLEALKEKALAEEAERQAKAEARKAEILAGKIF